MSEKFGCVTIPNSPPPNTSATLSEISGSSNNWPDSTIRIFPDRSLMKILSSEKSIAHGFSRFVAKISTNWFGFSLVKGSGIGRGADGDVKIIAEKIKAPIIPPILIR